MLILPGALPVAQPSEQVFATPTAPSPVKTVSAAAASTKTRNETGGNSNPNSGGQQSAILAPAPNPDKPTGPPPTFEANLLETEREKLRAGPQMPQADEPKAKAPEAPYSPPQAEHHEVDIAI